MNTLKKIVQQVGFIYKIIQGCRSTKHKILVLTYIFYCIAPLWLQVAIRVLIECGVQLYIAFAVIS